MSVSFNGQIVAQAAAKPPSSSNRSIPAPHYRVRKCKEKNPSKKHTLSGKFHGS
jgi:hypothetical protein